LVPRAQVGEFVGAVKAAFLRSFGDSTADNHDYTALINERHHARIVALLDDARAKGATVVSCGEGGGRKMPLQIVTNVSPDMRLAQEEIFGPILPVIPYDTVDDAVRYMHLGPRPLAMYLFGHDAAARETILRRTHAGGVTINDWGWHVLNHDAPFGGIGNSGMGTYHGVEGFRELSHAKAVFKRHRLFPIGLFYPPYGNLVQRLVLKLWLGKGDPALYGSAP
jgi:coniferyl-aldehyde dehydrogenase